MMHSTASRLLLLRAHTFQLSVHPKPPSLLPHFPSASGQGGSRSIASLTQLLKGRRSSGSSSSSNSAGSQARALNPHPADQVEAQRPLAPNPYDGVYKMPEGAPDPHSLSRARFHQFMHGKPQRFSKELKVTVMGCTLAGFGVGVTWLTAYIMRPDDFEWVEEERKRIQEAKERIQSRIDKAQLLQQQEQQQQQQQQQQQ
ncbi:hypothetical protein, conserved [Eimeria brunetti]|uniref:Chromosome III, complete sequence, related n=1 Tax=Eimeria brunetti TaxID=51314 RepID=U6LJX9_9EIME|nr:hypothetical protein, conserved [Eimeria brunetti]